MTLLPDPTTIEARAHRFPTIGPADARTVAFGKALFDKVFALGALILLFPVMIVIAAAIFATERQAVLFAQQRIGENGRLFKCWKFRTMARDADQMLQAILAADPDLRREWDETFKLQEDPRITRLGRFLRKTSLDELPQFWNVLLGQMSMVGPRPIVPDEVARYGDRYWAYACVRPGLTGVWQVKGRSDTTYAERVAMDVEYALTRSFMGDLGIILRTVYVVIFRVGAY